MAGELLLLEGRVLDFARTCREKTKTAESKFEALQLVADYASGRLEDYLLSVYEHPDEISVHFIQLLDQIVFELTENLPSDNAIREYIVEDLHTRLNIYLDAYHGKETYTGNLRKRILTHEDTIVIRQCALKEYIPLLLSEYSEQPLLQKSILRTLLSFEGTGLLDFYYTVARDPGGLDIKSMVLVGLKKFGALFRQWHAIGADHDAYASLAEYAKAFNCEELESNPVPGDLYSVMFVLQYIESNITEAVNERSLGWIMSLLETIPGIGYYNSSLTDLYNSICAILVYAERGALKSAVRDEEMARALVLVVDFLPREHFDGIRALLSLLGDDLIQRVGAMMASGKVKLDERESNMLYFMLWKKGNGL